MTSTAPLLFLLLIFLGATLLFVVDADSTAGRLSLAPIMAQLQSLQEYLLSPKDQPTTAPVGVRLDFSSGNSRFSQGICQTDADCVVSGCSGEVCGRHKVATSCELDESFPSSVSYQCACVAQKCGWRLR